MLKFNKEEGSKVRMKPHEANEVICMGVRALFAQNKYQEALNYINTHSKMLIDRVSRFEYLGKIHQQLGDEAQSVSAYENLL
jgi:predicted Zn-dependent protease